jgi:hypothetical protein
MLREHFSTNERERNAYKILLGICEGKRSFGRKLRRRKNNIKSGLEKWYWKMWIGFIWLKLGTSNWLVRVQW